MTDFEKIADLIFGGEELNTPEYYEQLYPPRQLTDTQRVTRLAPSPLVTDDSHWGRGENRHFIREAYACRRNPIFKDLFTKLRNA